MGRGVCAAVAFGALIGACFSAPGKPATGDANGPGDDDANLDPDADVTELSLDGAPDKCILDLFNGPGSGTCGPNMWADLSTSNGSGWLSNTGTGELVLALGSGAGYARCNSILTAAWNRVTVDVASVVTSGSGDVTFAGLSSLDGSQQWGVVFDYDASNSRTSIAVTCSGGTISSSLLRNVIREGWDPTAQRYVQIERTTSTTLDVRTSANNAAFSRLGTCTIPDGSVLLNTKAELQLQRASSGSGSATTQFGHIEICHD